MYEIKLQPEAIILYYGAQISVKEKEISSIIKVGSEVRYTTDELLRLKHLVGEVEDAARKLINQIERTKAVRNV